MVDAVEDISMDQLRLSAVFHSVGDWLAWDQLGHEGGEQRRANLDPVNCVYFCVLYWSTLSTHIISSSLPHRDS